MTVVSISLLRRPELKWLGFDANGARYPRVLNRIELTREDGPMEEGEDEVVTNTEHITT
jgi:hypothetical protein